MNLIVYLIQIKIFRSGPPLSKINSMINCREREHIENKKLIQCALNKLENNPLAKKKKTDSFKLLRGPFYVEEFLTRKSRALFGVVVTRDGEIRTSKIHNKVKKICFNHKIDEKLIFNSLKKKLSSVLIKNLPEILIKLKDDYEKKWIVFINSEYNVHEKYLNDLTFYIIETSKYYEKSNTLSPKFINFLNALCHKTEFNIKELDDYYINRRKKFLIDMEFREKKRCVSQIRLLIFLKYYYCFSKI